MKALLFPLILLVIGGAAGAAAGLFLKPEPPKEEMAETAESAEGETKEEEKKEEKAEEKKEEGEEKSNENPAREYVKLNNQFIVPVVEGGSVASMVVLSLTLEAMPGGREVIYGREPKLRDAFLQVLFDHANAGGFSGNFTSGVKMESLSSSLNATAEGLLGDIVTDVFITDIVRQDN